MDSLTTIRDPELLSLLETVATHFHAQHSQGFINQASGPIHQTFGEQRIAHTEGGDYAEHDIHKLNIFLLGNDLEQQQQLLAQLSHGATKLATELAVNLKRRQDVNALLDNVANVTWPYHVLIRAFRTVLPHREIPKSEPAPDFFQRLVHELVMNSAARDDLLAEFVYLLAHEEEIPQAQAILMNWLHHVGATPPRDVVLKRYDALLSESTSLLVGVKRMRGSTDRYQLRAWIWPEPGLVFQQTDESCTLDELPAHITGLHHRIMQQFALRANQLRVEFFLPNQLLSEPVQIWPIRVTIDDEGEEVEEYPIGTRYRVIVRSYERSFSQQPASKEARESWQAKWRRLPESCTMSWKQRQHPDDPPCAPIFHSISVDDYGQDLFTLLNDDPFVCYAETSKPPADLDYHKKVLLRVVRAGLPMGLWVRDQGRTAALYNEVATFLVASQLHDLPGVIKERRKKRGSVLPTDHDLLLSHLVLFYDDPERIPSNPDDAPFDAPK